MEGRVISKNDDGSKLIIPPDGDKGKTGKTEELEKTINFNTITKNN